MACAVQLHNLFTASAIEAIVVLSLHVHSKLTLHVSHCPGQVYSCSAQDLMQAPCTARRWNTREAASRLRPCLCFSRRKGHKSCSKACAVQAVLCAAPAAVILLAT